MIFFKKQINILAAFIDFQKEKHLLIKQTKKKHIEMVIEFERERSIETNKTLDHLLNSYFSNCRTWSCCVSDSNTIIDIFYQDIDDFKTLCSFELEKIKGTKFKDIYSRFHYF